MEIAQFKAALTSQGKIIIMRTSFLHHWVTRINLEMSQVVLVTISL